MFFPTKKEKITKGKGEIAALLLDERKGTGRSNSVRIQHGEKELVSLSHLSQRNTRWSELHLRIRGSQNRRIMRQTVIQSSKSWKEFPHPPENVSQNVFHLLSNFKYNLYKVGWVYSICILLKGGSRKFRIYVELDICPWFQKLSDQNDGIEKKTRSPGSLFL